MLSARGIPISPSARVVHHGPSRVPDRPSDRPPTGRPQAPLIGATGLLSRRFLVPGGHACASPYQTLSPIRTFLFWRPRSWGIMPLKEAHVELLSPAPRAMAALRDGRVDAVAAGAHTTLTAFPQWHGAKLVVALAQGTPWLLVLRADIPAQRGDLSSVKGLHLGAAPGPDAALRRLLADAAIDPARDGAHIGPVPGLDAPGAS